MNEFPEVILEATTKEINYLKASLERMSNSLENYIEENVSNTFNEESVNATANAESLKDKIDYFNNKLDLNFLLPTEELIKKQKINDAIFSLNIINYQMAELSRIKEELEKRLCDYLDHTKDGTQTYTCGRWKTTVTTGWNYTLDKDEYKILKDAIPSCFNPVVERTAYDLDKQIIRDCEKYGSPEDLEILSKVVMKKPKKLRITITAGV